MSDETPTPKKRSASVRQVAEYIDEILDADPVMGNEMTPLSEKDPKTIARFVKRRLQTRFLSNVVVK